MLLFIDIIFFEYTGVNLPQGQPAQWKKLNNDTLLNADGLASYGEITLSSIC